jgi:hypothetical protein
MSINQKIQAVFNLQRFVRMTRVLMPLYVDLLQKNTLNIEERRKLNRIENLYSDFNVSPEISKKLINSSIIEYIKAIYSFSKTHLRIKNSNEYNQFIKESDFLIDRWNKQMMN